jgi:hypothetical protein
MRPDAPATRSAIFWLLRHMRWRNNQQMALIQP